MQQGQQTQKMLIERLQATNEAVKAARDHTDKRFSFTRRAIALVGVVCIIGIPLLAGAIFPGMPVNYAHVQSTGGFLFFTEPTNALTWGTAYGITILPFHTHFISAIAGMYFGSSVTK